jgi:DeoR/GlpR family transcriptional regulator of sugar metabolism
MSSKTDKRAKEILRLLLSHGKTSVEELTRVFGTSPASVRRDLVRLEEQGLVHRTHGGALLAGQIYEPFRFDSSFNHHQCGEHRAGVKLEQGAGDDIDRRLHSLGGCFFAHWPGGN